MLTCSNGTIHETSVDDLLRDALREIAELRRRVEQLEGESRQHRQQVAMLRGRVDYAEMLAP